jgi:L-iditol 2-dehydrogenase/D-arabitol-phosphate dehydrogenase
MITDKMLGVTKTAPGYDQMALLEVEIPSPAADELLVKVAYTGICGSDIHTFKGE